VESADGAGSAAEALILLEEEDLASPLTKLIKVKLREIATFVPVPRE
jgi:hypothetical protein